VNGETFARILTGIAVLAVAVVAGIVSFTHIETLALGHGYTLGTARLLPVSVDGLIVASSLACLTEARSRGEASRLSRAGLALGIVATLAANVAAGAQFGIVGAVVNAWPAIAFIVASEILLRTIRATRDIPRDRVAAETVAPTTSAGVLEDVPHIEPARTASPTPVAWPCPRQWRQGVLRSVLRSPARRRPRRCLLRRSNEASCHLSGRSRPAHGAVPHVLR
jgi:Protein of unknown function (DUF2637)